LIKDPNRFCILVCVDGSEESYRGLRYAARVSRGVGADIALLYVRPLDQSLSSGGIHVAVARKNVLDWQLDLPGMRHLKRGRDVLVEAGKMVDDWEEEATHRASSGDPLGDFVVTYRNDKREHIYLILKTAPDIASGILDEVETTHCDLVIVGATGHRGLVGRLLHTSPVAEKVVMHAPCSVIVARELEEGRGHLICTDGSEQAMRVIEKDALLASRCDCPVSLISVARAEDSRRAAEQNVEAARTRLAEQDIDVVKTYVEVGNPVEEIVRAGRNHSLIVLSDTAKSGLRRFLIGSVAMNVTEHAENSVMIVR
jgi:nucleotide-binding universal stress UspA family protein